MPWYAFPLAVLAGFLSGFINTVAGSGSLITLPLLIFIGLPATVANGTNRIAILLQNVVAASSFQKRGVLDIRGTLLLGIPAVVGSILGAQIAVDLDEVLMRQVIGAVMILMLAIIILKPDRWLVASREQVQGLPSLALVLVFFAIGVYGGFIQAGVGIFLLGGLVLGAGYDLVRGNAAKVGIVLLFTISALLVFVRNDQVEWLIGTVMAVGSMFGAWVGAKFAIEQGSVWVRRLLIVIVGVSALELMGVFRLLANLI
ncbi:MAG: sulfite exporter TauE/SafE family protein [Chloroflexi bacterium]|nr:sulfite exporter TauE/SafE family protein [Chloroflexota bacterium]